MNGIMQQARCVTLVLTLAAAISGCAANPSPYPTTVDAAFGGPKALIAAKNPAIQAAAKIKLDKRQKRLKIASLKYLAKVGCGCYEQQFKVSEALLAAMADCDEDVRMKAVEAVCKTLCDGQCQVCEKTGCCNLAISKKLYEMAYLTDENGCPREPNEAIRQLAHEAYCLCPLYKPEPEKPEQPPIETPVETPVEVPVVPPVESDVPNGDQTRIRQDDGAANFAAQRQRQEEYDFESPRDNRFALEIAGVVAMVSGVVRSTDEAQDKVLVDFPRQTVIPSGSLINVYVDGADDGVGDLGEFEVIKSVRGHSVVRPVGVHSVRALSSGSRVTVVRTNS
jgi:hypothetical protein